MAAKSFIPYGRQTLTNRDIQSVIRCLKSEYLTQGPAVPEFEKALAIKAGAKYALAVANGTAALHLLALALHLKPGTEVVTTPISFLATSNCLLYAGLKPVFADVDPVTGNMTPELTEKKITKKTGAIFVTHLAGRPCDMRTFAKLAAKHKLILIEDAAHALGAQYEGRPVGDCRYSRAAIFSFHPVKHITTAEGGAVVTNDAKLAEKISILRTHGVTRDPRRLVSNPGCWHYEMQALGFNYRLTDMQAALGISQLQQLDGFIAARRRIAARYEAMLADAAGIGTVPESGRSKHAYHLYPVKLLSKKLKDAKKKIFDDLAAAGIGVQVHYIPIPSQPYYKKLGYSTNGLDGAREYFEASVSLPVYPRLKLVEQLCVVKILKKVVSKYL
ncbi:MAG TPA: UDP-4-amino-4,6-dideoxy-N-acetyl-beta-L-altrosamine transaminase [Candidatus Omnitrophota bacterium]|nr:UDP-4-amino-4,6-dideoxy-N-acetyl-beta-L-altrosamine transaminase [Candidatus Omnitrophota bacterium]